MVCSLQDEERATGLRQKLLGYRWLWLISRREACAKEPSAKSHCLLRLSVHSGFLVSLQPNLPVALDGTSEPELGRLGLPGASLAREDDLPQTGGCPKEVIRASEQPGCAEKHPRAAKGEGNGGQVPHSGNSALSPSCLSYQDPGTAANPTTLCGWAKVEGEGVPVSSVCPGSPSPSKKRAIH